MKVIAFHLMPYRHLDFEEASKHRSAWVVLPNSLYDPVKGADELYAELLLEGGYPKEAVEWFEKTLVRTPNRSRALLGLARARAKAGDVSGSREAYTRLLANWETADRDLPELNEARAALGGQ